APHDIEVAIKECSLVSQAVLVGDGRSYLVALISLNPETISAWAAKNSAQAPYHESKEIKDAIWAHIQKVNKTLASFETVKKIHLVPDDFTVENGFLTPTFKVKRSAVEKAFKAEIDALY
ncbi:MAG: hypothetical protein KDD53_11950, partial [Bdellovibrionales bacterium]|nr:hypothetical protein [Bdellovibrionales bacterium]